MGLIPEFFTLLGILIFLAMSLLSAVFDDKLFSRLQYIFQAAAAAGLGELLIGQRLNNAGTARFWLSIAYLTAALSIVVGVNIYLGPIRHATTIASVFSGTVTVPILMVSAMFVSSFLETGGQVILSPTTTLLLGVSVFWASLSTLTFLRKAARQIIAAKGIGLPSILMSMLGKEWKELLDRESGY